MSCTCCASTQLTAVLTAWWPGDKLLPMLCACKSSQVDLGSGPAVVPLLPSSWVPSCAAQELAVNPASHAYCVRAVWEMVSIWGLILSLLLTCEGLMWSLCCAAGSRRERAHVAQSASTLVRAFVSS